MEPFQGIAQGVPGARLSTSGKKSELDKGKF
jgi:hypothetical protein